MELFLLFPDLGSKPSLWKDLAFLLRSPYPVLQTWNRIIQAGNGIISPISRPWIQKLLWNIFTLFTQIFQTEIEIIDPIPRPILLLGAYMFA